MSTEALFPVKPPVLVPVVNESRKFPVNRIFCVGRNYMAHAAEMGVSVDKSTQSPFYFLKDAATYIPSGSEIPYPLKTQNYHHEIELVIAVGKQGVNIPASQAAEYIYGYACGLDMTRRDVQLAARDQGKPWDLGKNFDQSAVMSDIIPAADVQADVNAVNIELRVNGKTTQSSNTQHFIWNIAEIIEDLSTYYELQPGDLIFTGTPEGVGPVVAGDILEGSVEGIAEVKLQIR
ncbi:fumarylacetoacetate hydrolase family protein [Acinetobacter chinensis]|uniref:Fumarylacetoacetate hydrolase family protein n=1 Tax=Acinetobacter chinensis TaxID=2004650 RepID=A0ABU3WAQ8_9GAMM|nr:fumarylacetoacetate hydrolase family protein [Acinetobacter chinensis]MDV2467496.1 fumarylacetoacetate hydrolase family protein [Acinetobacter chinensis]